VVSNVRELRHDRHVDADERLGPAPKRSTGD
jgi:hypothetical protein